MPIERYHYLLLRLDPTAREVAIGRRYSAKLSGCPGLALPPDAHPVTGDPNSYWDHPYASSTITSTQIILDFVNFHTFTGTFG